MAISAETAPTSTPAAEKPAAPAALAIPLSDADAAAWSQRITAAERVTDEKAQGWKDGVCAYMVRGLKDKPTDDTVVVPLEYSYVELKRSQLAFQVPEVSLKPLLPGLENAVRVFQGALNHELGPEGANADALIEECLTDVLICGIAASKISYYADVREKQVPVMEPVTDVYGQPMPVDPQTGAQPMRQRRDPVTQQLVTQPQKYVATECYEWTRFPPEQLLLPVEFEGSDYDTAAWLGMRFQIALETAITRFGLPADFAPTVTRPRDTLSSDEQPDRETLTVKMVEGVEVWYQTAVFDPKADALKGALRRLVFVKNRTTPVLHEDSPYQYVDPADGRLKGMRGFPIHPLTLRFLPGSAYPVSDVDAGRAMSEENSKFRTQQIRMAERSMPFVGVDRTKMTPDDKRKVDGGLFKPNAVIGLDGVPSEMMQVFAPGQYPRANMEIEKSCRRDFEQAWSMGRVQTGLTEDGEPATATEINAAQSATDVRLDRERSRVLKWFTRGASKLGSLLQQFKDEPGYAEIVGEDGVKALQAWNRQQIAGEYAYQARPDSALRIDAQAARAQKLDVYNKLGNDPNVNRVELLKDIVKEYGLSPTVVVEQLPPKGPEPPKLNFSFKGEDLALVNPQFPLILAILLQGGVQIGPEAIQNAQQIVQQFTGLAALMGPQDAPQPGADTAHGGMTTDVQPLNKHSADHGPQQVM